MIKTESVQHTAEWEIKKEEEGGKEKEVKRVWKRGGGEGRGIRTGLQGQGHAERIICTSNSVSHMQAQRQMCAEGQKEKESGKRKTKQKGSMPSLVLIDVSLENADKII